MRAIAVHVADKNVGTVGLEGYGHASVLEESEREVIETYKRSRRHC